ncbi:hypothetical protein OROGR_007537 [Orobanche gracilis]
MVFYCMYFLAKPPGTAESQALVFSVPDCGDVNSSPVGVMDASDQMLLPVGFTSFESFNPPPPVAMEECLSKNQDNLNIAMSSGPVNQTQMSYTREVEHMLKAEALMIFTAELELLRPPPVICPHYSQAHIFQNPKKQRVQIQVRTIT